MFVFTRERVIPHVSVADEPGLACALRKIASWGTGKPPPFAAAAICYVLVAYHPLNEGNHRTGCWAGKEVLLLNGWSPTSTDEDDKEFYEQRIAIELECDLRWRWDVLAPLVPALDEFDRLVEDGLSDPYGRMLRRFYFTYSKSPALS